MAATFRQMPRNRLRAVILDWSGTTVDYGSIAPAVVIVEVFARQGVTVTMAEARAPMGIFKRDHIRQVAADPAVIERWRAVHGRTPDEDDVEAMYHIFTPIQADCIARYADLIPGVRLTVDVLRQRGMRIGTTTGYTHAMMEPLLPLARQQGYEPDVVVCPDDVPAGRPAPWMAFRNAMLLDVYPMSSIVKIGDTLPDIAEGLNAGMWTIGLTRTGSELGLTEAETRGLHHEELSRRLDVIARRFYDAGAHEVVQGMADVLPALDRIEARLARGEKP